MPRISFSSEFPQMRGQYFNWSVLEDMKVRWGVSLKAIIYRASKLGLISPEKAASGFTYLSRSGQTREENGDERLSLERPTVIQKAIDLLDYSTWRTLITQSGLNEFTLTQRYKLKVPQPHLRIVE